MDHGPWGRKESDTTEQLTRKLMADGAPTAELGLGQGRGTLAVSMHLPRARPGENLSHRSPQHISTLSRKRKGIYVQSHLSL